MGAAVPLSVVPGSVVGLAPPPGFPVSWTGDGAVHSAGDVASLRDLSGRSNVAGTGDRTAGGVEGDGIAGRQGSTGGALDMQAILNAIQSVNLNVNTRFTTLEGQFVELRSELSSLKTEVVTRSQFESLETRVFQLESNVVSTENPDVRFLQQQLDRLDPAHKCLSIIGFKGEAVGDRTQVIETFMRDKLGSLGNHARVEHVFKGKYNERKLAGVSLMQFPSKTDRDAALRLIKDSHLVLTDQGVNLRFDYAKTKRQLNRNFCVNKALEMIKRDAFAKDKKVEAEWKHSEKGKRSITVDGQDVFLQLSSDMSGRFLEPVAHLHFE